MIPHLMQVSRILANEKSLEVFFNDVAGRSSSLTCTDPDCAIFCFYFHDDAVHHIDAKTAVSFISPDAGTDRVFDNADSFAMVFDRTWKQLRSSNKAELSQEEHLEAVLEAMADHPFLISSPDMARQVAAFRIRLLELA